MTAPPPQPPIPPASRGRLSALPVPADVLASPAKQVLGMRVVDAHTGAPASFGRMVMREIVWSIVLALGSAVTAGILGLVDGLYVFGETRQRLLDRMAHTLVVRI